MSNLRRANAVNYHRGATSVDRCRQQGYASWFRDFDWTWSLTLTFDRHVGLLQAGALLECYLRELEVRSGDTLSCLIVMEQKHYSGLGMPAGRVHFHLLIATTAELTAEIFEDYWERLPYGGDRSRDHSPSARALPYDAAISATYYLFKTLHESPDNWSLRRLALMSPTRPKSWHTSAGTRRSIRRHEARGRVHHRDQSTAITS
jgi:hypothetical protein